MIYCYDEKYSKILLSLYGTFNLSNIYLLCYTYIYIYCLFVMSDMMLLYTRTCTNTHTPKNTFNNNSCIVGCVYGVYVDHSPYTESGCHVCLYIYIYTHIIFYIICNCKRYIIDRIFS